MDHDDTLATACSLVSQVESIWLAEVQLDRGDGLVMASAVTYLQVELGAVERRFPLCLDEGWIELAKHPATDGPQRVVGVLPLLRGPEVAITVVPAGEPYVVDRQPEHALGLQCRPKRAFHLVRDLVPGDRTRGCHRG